MMVETWETGNESTAQVTVREKNPVIVSVVYDHNTQTIQVSLGASEQPPTVSLTVKVTGLALEVMPVNSKEDP